METMAMFIGGKLGIGVLALLGSAVGLKLVHKLISSLSAKAIKKMLDPRTDDPRKAALIKKAFLANVELAEYCIPDRDKGSERKALVAAIFGRIMPRAAAETVSELIEEAVVTMDENLKKAVTNVPTGEQDR